MTRNFQKMKILRHSFQIANECIKVQESLQVQNNRMIRMTTTKIVTTAAKTRQVSNLNLDASVMTEESVKNTLHIWLLKKQTKSITNRLEIQQVREEETKAKIQEPVAAEVHLLKTQTLNLNQTFLILN